MADILRYVIFLKAVPGAKLTDELLRAHVDHLKALYDRGILELAGPFRDHNFGMIVVRAESRDEAVDIAESDPFIIKGYREYELRTLEMACPENNFGLPD